jgi:small-conductance mechanosensitive channel
LRDVVAYLPQVIIAAIILLAAVIIADVMQKLISSSARSARLKSANFLGSVAKWVIWIFAFLIVLDHLGVATPFVQMLFTGVVIAVSLAIGLSFGLGGQSAASGFIEKMREEISDRN